MNRHEMRLENAKGIDFHDYFTAMSWKVASNFYFVYTVYQFCAIY